MSERDQGQLTWEEDYLKKVERVKQILSDERTLLKNKTNRGSTFDPPAWKYGQTTTSPQGSTTSSSSSSSSSPPNGVGGTREGTFVLPTNIKIASISGDKIIIPTGNRTDYHQARDIAAKNSKYAGFQSINDDLYAFKYAQENYFAPDFIPILVLMHSRISPAINKPKILISSGTRTEKEDVEWDAHMGGYAVDISATDKDRWTIADVCWNLGLRGVAVGNTFVHIDAGPDPVVGWSYGNGPKYRGPSTPR